MQFPEVTDLRGRKKIKYTQKNIHKKKIAYFFKGRQGSILASFHQQVKVPWFKVVFHLKNLFNLTTYSNRQSKILYKKPGRGQCAANIWSGPLEIARPHFEQICIAVCPTLNVLQITAFPSLNSLSRVDLPSFVYIQILFQAKQGILLCRTYCYTEQARVHSYI